MTAALGQGNRSSSKRCTISRKVFVGNLSFNLTRDDLLELFGSVGAVSDVVLPLDRSTGRPRGFAFVEFASEEEAAAAIKAVDGKELGGRPLKVSEARERLPRIPSDMSGPHPFGPRNRPFKTKGSRRGIRARKRSL